MELFTTMAAGAASLGVSEALAAPVVVCPDRKPRALELPPNRKDPVCVCCAGWPKPAVVLLGAAGLPKPKVLLLGAAGLPEPASGAAGLPKLAEVPLGAAG
jgi:hypothetical protein